VPAVAAQGQSKPGVVPVAHAAIASKPAPTPKPASKDTKKS